MRYIQVACLAGSARQNEVAPYEARHELVGRLEVSLGSAHIQTLQILHATALSHQVQGNTADSARFLLRLIAAERAAEPFSPTHIEALIVMAALRLHICDAAERAAA